MNCCCCGTQTEESCENQNKNGSLLSMVVGPFPDEVIMNALDRIIFTWGASKMKGLIDVQDSGSATKDKSSPSLPSLPLPSGSSRPSGPPRSSCQPRSSGSPRSCCQPRPSSSAYSLCRCCSSHSMNSSSCPSRANDRKGKDSSAPSSPKSVCFNSSRINAAACCPRQPTTNVDFAHPADDIRKQKGGSSFSMKDRLMQAEIVCSAACQALKSRLKSKSPRDGCKDKKWLWTRLVPTKNGCQMYEVYQGSDSDCSPPKIGSKGPAFVFLVLRNGNIMPFQAIAPV